MIPRIIHNQKDLQGVESHHQCPQENSKGDFITNLGKAVEETTVGNADGPKDMLSFLLAKAWNLGLMPYLRPCLKKGRFQAKGRLVAKEDYPFFFLGVFFKAG